ncbi:unnamed protein product [Anisakis simplex]|uniref:Centromere protein X n=1 Tax=Anisakis simplex TaxID=6269 RepID=A0A0M3JHB1_ANISI|nr:unnamed protein product [Anisakis simplex]
MKTVPPSTSTVLNESTVRQCLQLRNTNETRQYSDEMVKLITQLAVKLIKETLHRSVVSALDSCSNRVQIDHFHRIIAQIIIDFDL